MNEIEIYKTNPSDFYSLKFYSKLRKCRPWQASIGKMVALKYDIKSVVDFGCGLGFYLEGMHLGGASNIKGFEYMYQNAKTFIPLEISSFIEYGDVMEKMDCGKFDCAMSVEVAEHILPEKSEIFISNITNASNKYVLFTSACPGQGGTGHINERPREYWIDMFKRNGYLYSEKDVETIRDMFGLLQQKSKYINVIKRNLMFFRRINL